MAIEKVPFRARVYDTFMEFDLDEIKDNSVYEIRFKNVKDVNGEPMPDQVVKIITSLSPMYATIMDVQSILDIEKLPEDIVLYNIRAASRYADYILNKAKLKYSNLVFEVNNFVRYRALKDCLLKLYMSGATSSKTKGTLGYVTYEDGGSSVDISKLLKYLDDEIKYWEDAIEGYFEGRAKMATAIKGYHHGGRNPYTSIEKQITPKGVPIGLDRGVH